MTKKGIAAGARTRNQYHGIAARCQRRIGSLEGWALRSVEGVLDFHSKGLVGGPEAAFIQFQGTRRATEPQSTRSMCGWPTRPMRWDEFG